MIILGIGNVLQKDDGIGIYAATYLKENYMFSSDVEVINGGVEGLNLFPVFEKNDHILILDSISLEDDSGSIYLIPSYELGNHGLNIGSAHEIGVMQCLDMLELQGKPVPKTTVLGIIPKHITFEMALSPTLTEAFEEYVKAALNYLKKESIEAIPNEHLITLQEIIDTIALTPSPDS